MAYSKQTWTDDVSAVTGARMTHIEQGIYDNSLATDKINPSGTATTSSEIEEGQINDVIGFKSLKLKGQTSQVSYNGYNILKGIIENKTTNGVTITKNEDNSYKVSGTATAVALFSTNINTTLEASKTYVIGFGNSNSNVQLSIRPSDGSTQYANTTTQKYVTYTPNENIDIRLFVRVANGATVNETIHPIIYVGNTEKSYEPYVGEKASPNPDFPQEVNNVSGDNVIGISNKNIISVDDFTTTAYGITITKNGNIWEINGTATANNTFRFIPNIQKKLSGGYALSSKYISGTKSGTANFNLRDNTSDSALFNVNLTTSNTSNTSTLNNVIKYAIYIANGATFSNYKFSPQLEKGTSATSYIAHQGNEFEVNLEGINLFNKYDYIEVNGTPNFGSSTGTFTGGGANSCIVIPCKSNTTYTAQKLIGGNADRFAFGCSATIPSSTDGTTTSTLNGARNDSAKSITITTGASAKYLIMHYYRNTETTYTKQQLLDSIQIELGNQATTYIPYNENPIELCKIGTYQDYIYKKDGKWWKHKEIEKIVLNGTESWSIANTGTSNFYYQVAGLTTPKSQDIMPKSDYFIGIAITNSNTDVGAWIISSGTIRLRTITEDTVANFKTWLSTNTPSLYYVLATPIEEEITYTPLIKQLDELYNSGLYDVTNINQDNSNEAFILDIEACKNNINGIVEYIRR